MATFDDLTPYSQPSGAAVEDAPSDKPTRATKRDDIAFLKLARERFQIAQEADKRQREREQADLQFFAGDQWPDDVKTAREGQNAQNGLPPVPARPCLTINKVREPVRQVLNQERGSDIGVELVPADDFGDLAQPIDPSEVELREGLVRRIQRESEAHDARTWAFARAVQAGRGYYAVLTRYLPGKTRDQEVYLHRIYNQASVTLDPSHEQPDGSDAQWGFIGTDLPWTRYKAEHPDSKKTPNLVSAASDEDFRAFGEAYPEWFRTEKDLRFVRVVDYWYTELEQRTLAMLDDGTDAWEDELTDAQRQSKHETRSVPQPQVKWAKIDALQVLEETDWPSEYLPIVKVLGEELQPYDKERRVEGMVRSMREPSQGYNYMVSALVERIGLAPLAPLMVEEGQVEGYEAWYEQANTRTLPYLPFKRTNLEGAPTGQPPFRTDTGLGQIIGPLTEAVSMFNDANQSVSSIHDPNLGKYDPSAKSGKAIMALQQQGNLGTSNFMDNLTRSIRYEGKIINSLLFPIYGRPGRVARILTGEDEPDTVQIGQPGQPNVPKQPGQQPTVALTEHAHFNVVVKVTKSFDRRREQEAQTLGEVIGNAPALLNVLGDLYFKNQDGPGHDEMAERMKATLDPRVLAMMQAKQQGQAGPEQMQHLQQQLQMVTQQAQAMHQQIQSDTAKYDAQFKIEQMKATADTDRALKLAAVNNAAKIEAARITAGKQAADTILEAQEEQIALNHEAVQSHLDRQHDVGLAAQQHAQQMQQGAQQAQVAQQSQQADQQHQAQMAQQQQDAQAQQAQQPPQGGQ